MRKRELLLKHVLELGLITLGNFILALGICAFIIPSGLISGGATGIALIIQNFTHIDVSISVLVINIIMFLIGYAYLGKRFAMTTLFSTFLYPFFLAMLEKNTILQHVTNDVLLSTIYAGFLIGVGMGLVIRQGASTGGMDIPPLVINKKTGISLSALINIFDIMVLLGQSCFSSMEEVLYGIIVVIISTIVLDKTLMLGTSSIQLTIISSHIEEIRDIILNEMDRGCTYLKIITGYQKVEQLALLCVVSKRELHQLNQLILNVDSEAFIISNPTHSVNGRGFTLPDID